MGLTRRLSLLCVGAALLAAGGIARELGQRRAIDAYNLALRDARYAAAAAHPGDAGREAAAHAALLAGQHQEARLIYGRLERSADRARRVAALYNGGNTYLEQATTPSRSIRRTGTPATTSSAPCGCCPMPTTSR